MTYFDKNIEAIKHRDIVLYDQMQMQQERLIDRVMSEPSRDGNAYLKVFVGGKWIALNSTYAPLKEAETFSKKYCKLPLYGRVLCLGFGNGYFARALMHLNQGGGQPEEANAKRKFAFYEPDPAVFTYAMQTYDLTDILEDENISVFVEGMNGGQLPIWCNENVDNFNEGLFYLESLPKYKECYQDAFIRIQNIYQDTLDKVHAFQQTTAALAGRIAENNLYNLNYFAQAANFSRFAAGYPKQLPYVIVSAGPSLKKRLRFLKQIQGKAFIMAVDTAAGYLLEQGVRPDGIMCIDPKKEMGLFSEHMQDIPFFVHTDVNWNVLDKVRPKQVYFISTNLLYYEQLAGRRGDRLECLEAGGSVATMAFSLAAFLEVETVVLTGQDLSVTEDATHVVSMPQRTGQAEHVFFVPGNEQEAVNTFHDFYVYLQWFEQEIQKHPNMKIYNATAGGARIAGAVYAQPEALSGLFTDTAEMYAELQQVLRDSGFRTGKAHTLRPEDLFHDIESAMKDAAGLIRAGKHLTEEFLSSGQEQDMFTKAVKVNQQLGDIGAALDRLPEFELLTHYLQSLEQDLLNNLYEEREEKEEDLIMIYQKLDRYYSALTAHMESFMQLCQQALLQRS